MTIFTAPKLRSYLFYVLFSLASIVFFTWAFFADKSSSRNGILVFGAIWILFILLAWFWVGNFTKQIEVNNKNLIAILQNGKQFHLRLTDLKQVKLLKRMGYYEIIFRDNGGNRIIVTSHLKNFDVFIKILVDNNLLKVD